VTGAVDGIEGTNNGICGDRDGYGSELEGLEGRLKNLNPETCDNSELREIDGLLDKLKGSIDTSYGEAKDLYIGVGREEGTEAPADTSCLESIDALLSDILDNLR